MQSSGGRADLPDRAGSVGGIRAFVSRQEKGFFEQQGLRVDLIVLTGLAERNSALQANRIDALAAPVTCCFSRPAATFPLKL